MKNTTFSLIGLLRNEPITVLFKVLNTRTEIKDQGRTPPKSEIIDEVCAYWQQK